LIICETEFETEDPNTGYSRTEIDYYSHIPFFCLGDVRQHRLTLRKNLRTNEYEVIRVYKEWTLTSRESLTIISGREVGRVEVVFKSQSLQEAVEFANEETRKYWGSREPDVVCEHKPPKLYWNCKIWKETPLEERLKAYRERRRGDSNEI